MAKRPGQSDLETAKSALSNRSLVLVGMMGAGKTSVGRRIAEKLELPFADADHEIETAAGKSIPEIFADHGESYFREGERRVIARLLEESPKVLATGGGAFMSEETRAHVKARGISVWLKADIDLLLQRVGKRDNRPLLKQGDPRQILSQLLEQREPVYELADITVESRDAQHSRTMNEIIRALAQWHSEEMASSDS